LIQGEAANITKLASIYFYNYIIENQLWGIVKIIHVVHDEVLIEYPKELKESIEPVLKDCLERAGKVFCKRIPLTATPATGKHWIH
jgi:DNA polymerase I-like protein with 3'-5' exonuclease and polymerase domains